MTADELLAKIGIEGDGEYEDGVFILQLADSNAYARAYSLLDKSELVDLDASEMSMTPEGSEMLYLADEYDVRLKANFDDNVYEIYVEESKE